MPNAKLGAKVDRYSFFVRFLPPLLHTGLARRTNIAMSLIGSVFERTNGAKLFIRAVFLNGTENLRLFTGVGPSN
jgi:hypothetical protein